MPAADWEHWQPSSGLADETQVRNLFRAVMGLHSTFRDEVWLWRGQSDQEHGLQPAMHTRLEKTAGLAFAEANAEWATVQLLERARRADLDVLHRFRLPDLALLAHLQHHGAATPLLDVSTDPLVALWMVAHAAGPQVAAHDTSDGLLFAIKKPPKENWIEPLDSRSYGAGGLRSALSTGAVYWYRPPDVSERLRIQRGSFLLGPLIGDRAAPISLPLKRKDRDDASWFENRINGLGRAGQPTKRRTEVAVFNVRAVLKPLIRIWLEQRAGLTVGAVYPTAWEKPFLDEFCVAHGRLSPISY